MPSPAGAAEQVARQAIDAARWAPSVLNTQPWWFGLHGARISLHEDIERRMPVADPTGREAVISCGAALLTLRVALCRLGRTPEVDLLPDPDRPALLADVSPGRPCRSEEDTDRMYEQIRLRRSHRGGFRAPLGPPDLPDRLRVEARQEGAVLLLVADSHTRDALAALTQAAEHVQRLDPRYVAEAALRSYGPPGPAGPENVEPYFPGRGRSAVPGTGTAELGTVALVVTEGDARADWLRAGQALQRVLLRAAVAGVSAAFHTQPLEVPELREFVRTRFCAGRYPQVLLRLGVADRPPPGTRRPAEEVVAPEP
ncbi:hypothetical protein DPM19_20175 [Actinomadura craniellae]|uniref:Nitroreductase n=2 Tax=Actinomadura craniellae TaxID=2231787 RepID=A0A365H349_9ACTN|nr:hypothetical protein DPM19_20175 [Actinomadura craniellae]